jgi:hypothetical protein
VNFTQATRAAVAEREVNKALESAKSGNQRADFEAERTKMRLQEAEETASEAVARTKKVTTE